MSLGCGADNITKITVWGLLFPLLDDGVVHFEGTVK
jgi:hypothetical protein